MTPKTIDISTGCDLLRDADPIGLHHEVSVRQYLEQLRIRIGERFPQARVFLRWSPSTPIGTDVYTIPRAQQAETELMKIAREVRAKSEEWLSYDDDVRSDFAV